MITNYIFEILRSSHIYFAITFIFILTLLIPLTIQYKKIHKLIGIIYLFVLVILLLTGNIMDINQLVISPNNFHALINIFFKNLSFSIFTFIGVLVLFNQKESVIFLFRLLVNSLYWLSMAIFFYGLSYNFIEVNTNRSNPLMTSFYVLPSYILLGGFYFWITKEIRNNDYFEKISYKVKIKYHKQLMSSALFLNLLSPLTAEINRVDIFHTDLLFCCLILAAILFYKLCEFFEKKTRIYGVILFLSLAVIIFSLSVYTYNQKNNYQFFALKIISFDKDYSYVNKEESKTVDGCEALPILQNFRRKDLQIIKIYHCKNALSSRYLLNDTIIAKSNSSKKINNLTSVTGVGSIADNANFDIRFPFVLVNAARGKENILMSVDDIFKKNKCRIYIDLKVVNYLLALPNLNTLKIYYCENMVEAGKEELLLQYRLDEFKGKDFNYLWMYLK